MKLSMHLALHLSNKKIVLELLQISQLSSLLDRSEFEPRKFRCSLAYLVPLPELLITKLWFEKPD